MYVLCGMYALSGMYVLCGKRKKKNCKIPKKSVGKKNRTFTLRLHENQIRKYDKKKKDKLKSTILQVFSASRENKYNSVLIYAIMYVSHT